MTSVTPPVLLDAPSGASPTIATAGMPSGFPPVDPAIAAEFAALLDSATAAVIPSPPEPSPGTLTAATPILSGREGDGETARSAAPTDILDSATTIEDRAEISKDDSVSLDPAILAIGGKLCGVDIDISTPVPEPIGFDKLATNGQKPNVELDGSVCVKTIAPREEAPQLPESVRPLPKSPINHSICGGAPVEISDPVRAKGADDVAIPEAIFADVTAISGGAELGASPEDASSESGERESAALDLGEGVLANRASSHETTSTIEARPLDRSERTKVVHEVINRVAKHIDTLAVIRSREPLRIQLEPAELGRIVVEVSRDASGLVADLAASDARVAETLDRHRGELAAGLAARGHLEARITVQTASNAEMAGFDLRRDGQSSPQSGQHQGQHTMPKPFATSLGQPMRLDRAAIGHRTSARATGIDLQI